MSFVRRSMVRLSGILLPSILVSCGPPSVNYVVDPTPGQALAAAAPVQSNAQTPPAERPKLAILPFEDEKLFRSERALLRFELGGHIARLLPDRLIVPLSEVDAKLRPLSSVTGHLCAFEGEPIERRAQYKGWQTTRFMHVAGLATGPGEALWVEIVEGTTTVATLEGPWNPRVPRVDAYRAAFAAFVRKDGGGVLGGLGVRGSHENALQQGSITICERKSFGFCEKTSPEWIDAAGALEACFAGSDEIVRDFLVQGDVGPYCEMENLDYLEGREGPRETCVCKALGTSAAMNKRPGRRTIGIQYESADIRGKVRPQVRVVEATTNIHVEDDWHSIEETIGGKKQYSSVHRLSTDNLDNLDAPLARCNIAAGTFVVADLDVREDGYVSAAKVISRDIDKQGIACIEQALGRGAFNCTEDGRSARVRVGLEWRSQ